MFVNFLTLSSLVEADKTGLSVLAESCGKITDGATSVGDLWPGKEESLSEYVVVPMIRHPGAHT